MSKESDKQFVETVAKFRNENDEYMIARLEKAISYINDGNHHMAVAVLLADISALKG